jgi:hypothetical protein
MKDHGKFEVAPEYIRSNYDRSDRLAVVALERPSGHMKQMLASAEEIASPAFQARLRALNAHDHCIYLSANALHPEATSRTKADVQTIRHVYLDIDKDGKAVVDRILAAKEMPEPHSIVHTSPDKYQLTWAVACFDKNQAEQLVREMAAHHGADQAVWDSARVLRVPGFRNCKLETPHYVSVESRNQGTLYTPRDFPRYQIERPVPQFGVRPTAENASGPDRSKSGQDWAYTLNALEKGIQPEVVRQHLVERRRNDKPDVENYARRTVENAQKELVARPMPEPVPSRSTDRAR